MSLESRGIVYQDGTHTAELFLQDQTISHRSDVPVQAPQGLISVTRLGDIIGSAGIDGSGSTFILHPDDHEVGGKTEWIQKKLEPKKIVELEPEQPIILPAKKSFADALLGK